MTSATPRVRMRERLRFLYGEETGDAAFADLARLLDALPPRARSASSEDTFDQTDALLITYGDTFLADNATPLSTLRAFAERHLDGLVSAIHILPFFPYSSDYGFSVIDYEQVDRELGSWADVEALGKRFDLMFDFVANHCSVERPLVPGVPPLRSPVRRLLHHHRPRSRPARRHPSPRHRRS